MCAPSTSSSFLLRLEHERQLQPQIAPLPPDLVLSPTEQIEPLLWLGCAHLLYDKPDLRLALTRICQICGHNSRDGDDLHRHLHADHPQHMEDIQSFKEMFQWSLFQEQGCFCNPSPGWGIRIMNALASFSLRGLHTHSTGRSCSPGATAHMTSRRASVRCFHCKHFNE